MPTKTRTKESEEWIVAIKGPLGHFTTTRVTQRKDVISYSANRPPYVSFNTCSHTRDYPPLGELPRLPCSPVATGQLAEVARYSWGDMPTKVSPTSCVTYAYSKENACRVVRPHDEAARVYDAVLTAYAQARSIPSILQPVIELKDVKQTVRQATELASWLMSRPSSVRQYIRKGTTFGKVVKDFIRSTVDKSSNAYLMSIFGILPTVGDTAKIARSVANPNRFVKARSNVIPKNTVLKAGFRCDTSGIPFDMSARVIGRSFQLYTRWAGDRDRYLDSTAGLPELSLSLLGSDEWYDVRSVHGLVFIKARVDTEVDNSLLNDWNFTQNPGSIPWELVPFSFVVDWFYDVGSQLQRAEKRSNVYRRVRITDFSQPWVCTHRERYSLTAACEPRSSLSGVHAYNSGPDAYIKEMWGTATQFISRHTMKNYISRSFERGPWQGHLYDLPRQEFRLPVRPYQVAASLALLAQKFLSLGRN